MKTADIKAHYAADIKSATDAQLFAIIKGNIKASKAIVEALKPMAHAELNERGVKFPEFTAWFA